MPSLLTPARYLRYEEAAAAYLKSLPLEHFMEATAQGTQRKITLASLELVHTERPEVQFFNELLVQYPLDDEDKELGQVVPDNMVVLWKEPIKADTSYNIPFEPVKPFWVLEYVSKHSQRKDYKESFYKYEHELKVPYYLTFYPDKGELTLYKLTQGKYLSVKPNKDNRCPIKKLELEVALLDGWVRFWFRGELLQLPGELLRELQATREQLARAVKQAEHEAKRAEHEAKRAEQEKQARLAAEQENAALRQELERLREQKK
jgi:hypothetical protein